MDVFFAPDLIQPQDFYPLPEEEAKHAIRVLRLKKGDPILLNNGCGKIFNAEIAEDSKNHCIVKINGTFLEQQEKVKLHMLVAPTKNIERFEWFLEKATEIGISSITPIITQNSERTVIKPERLEKILIAAIKQSHRAILPALKPMCHLKNLNEFQGDVFIAHCKEDNEKADLKNALKGGNESTILIGPEGDFTQEEIQLCKSRGAVAVNLSGARLRTETAALVACHTFNLINS